MGWWPINPVVMYAHACTHTRTHTNTHTSNDAQKSTLQAASTEKPWQEVLPAVGATHPAVVVYTHTRTCSHMCASTTNTHSTCFAWPSARTTNGEVLSRSHTSFSSDGKKIQFFKHAHAQTPTLRHPVQFLADLPGCHAGELVMVKVYSDMANITHSLTHTFKHARTPSVSTVSLCTHWQTFPT